jgi:hypothetical protein
MLFGMSGGKIMEAIELMNGPVAFIKIGDEVVCYAVLAFRSHSGLIISRRGGRHPWRFLALRIFV